MLNHFVRKATYVAVVVLCTGSIGNAQGGPGGGRCASPGQSRGPSSPGSSSAIQGQYQQLQLMAAQQQAQIQTLQARQALYQYAQSRQLDLIGMPKPGRQLDLIGSPKSGRQLDLIGQPKSGLPNQAQLLQQQILQLQVQQNVLQQQATQLQAQLRAAR